MATTRATRSGSKTTQAEQRAKVAQARARALHDALERLTPPRQATASVTIKLSAQGQFMPEVTITADTPDETVETMIRQAVDAFSQLSAAKNGTTPA